jgi:hypothetical protein
MKNKIELLEKSNIPLIPSKISKYGHKVFIKYTSGYYYKYIYEQLNILCVNSKSINKNSLFYKSLKCLLKILYNSNNYEYILDLDLLILSSFYLGLKLNELITKVPKIKKLKEIYPEKYSNFEPQNIKKAEIICIKLLEYNIDILTVYDCLVFLLNDNNYLFDLTLKELDDEIKNNLYNYIERPPMEIAHYCISKAKCFNFSEYYIRPSILLKEYNTNKEKQKNSKNRVQLATSYKKVNYLNRLSKEEIKCSTNESYRKPSNSIYNCSFKILRKLSNVSENNKSNNLNINSISEIKNNFKLNISRSILGKKLYENDMYNSNRKPNMILKSLIYQSTNKNKEEKENYSNTNLLSHKNKDINCLRKRNKVIMVEKRQLFKE